MKKLNQKSDEVTVVIEVSFKENFNEVKKYIREEQCPLFFNLNDDGIIRFEWFVDEDEKGGTLIEVFQNSNVWEELGNKIIGSPVNIRFMELFNVEKLSVLGEINEKFFEIKLKPCDQNYQESEFKDPHFYHPISFDINFNKKIYKKPINLIKACTISKKLKFIINK